MTTKKQYLTARRWLDQHKGLIDKYRAAVREYESQPNRAPYEGITPDTLIQDIPEFNRFNLGAIETVAMRSYKFKSSEKIKVRHLAGLTFQKWSESYGIGSGTIAKIKAAVKAAGLKMKRK